MSQAPGVMPGLLGRIARNQEIRSTGLLNSHVPGRTDRLPLGVHPNSYVIPADVVSGLGQGNTLSGGHILDKMFEGMKSGTPKTGHSMPKKGMKDGGQADAPVMVAGGEYIVHPDVVKHLGRGDHSKGHRVLDKMVKNVREHTIKALKKLPSPKK